MVIELAGLPGAGKTSLVRAITVQHVGRGDARLSDLTPALAPTAANLRLVMGAAPFAVKSLGIALKTAWVLRSYQQRRQELPVIIDQGVAQKLWSILVEARSFSAAHLEEAVRKLAPYAADHIVWIDIPAELAAARIAGRRGGTSRFDGLSPLETARLLKRQEVLYPAILRLFERHTRARILRLNGEDALADNAERIAALIKSASSPKALDRKTDIDEHH